MVNIKDWFKKYSIYIIIGFIIAIIVLAIIVLANYLLNIKLKHEDQTIRTFIVISYILSVTSASFNLGKSFKKGDEYNNTKATLIGFFLTISIIGYCYIIFAYTSEFILIFILAIITIALYIGLPLAIIYEVFEEVPSWRYVYKFIDIVSTYGTWVSFFLTLFIGYFILPIIYCQIPAAFLVGFFMFIWFIGGILLAYTKFHARSESKETNDVGGIICLWIVFIIFLIIGLSICAIFIQNYTSNC